MYYNEDEMPLRRNNGFWITTIGGGIIILIGLIILVLNCTNDVKLSESGDAIGGITAPLCNLIGSILVFWITFILKYSRK